MSKMNIDLERKTQKTYIRPSARLFEPRLRTLIPEPLGAWMWQVHSYHYLLAYMDFVIIACDSKTCTNLICTTSFHSSIVDLSLAEANDKLSLVFLIKLPGIPILILCLHLYDKFCLSVHAGYMTRPIHLICLLLS